MSERTKEFIEQRDKFNLLVAPLSKSVRKWIKSVISNDESSFDEELIEFFSKDIGKELSKEIVSCRPYFLCHQIIDILENDIRDEDFAN